MGVGHGDPQREVDVRLYPNLAALRSAATRHENVTFSRRRRQSNRYHDTLGICQRFERRLGDQSLPLCAIVRLAPPYLGVGVVTHELAHAALWVWELDHPHDDQAGPPRGLRADDDEDFCWVLGDLVRVTFDWLHRLGCYDGHVEDPA